MLQHMIVRVPLLFVFLLLPTLTAWPQSAGTKPIYPIEFKPGVKTTVVEGTVSPPRTVGPDMTNEGSERYSLRAKAGQYLTIEISSDNNQAVFSLIQPSPGMVKYEIVERAGRVKRWSGRLKMSGNYLVVVWTPEREANSRFKLSVRLR
jgi:hypothetical protein